jgi:hypothetical protein
METAVEYYQGQGRPVTATSYVEPYPKYPEPYQSHSQVEPRPFYGLPQLSTQQSMPNLCPQPHSPTHCHQPTYPAQPVHFHPLPYSQTEPCMPNPEQGPVLQNKSSDFPEPGTRGNSSRPTTKTKSFVACL